MQKKTAPEGAVLSLVVSSQVDSSQAKCFCWRLFFDSSAIGCLLHYCLLPTCS